MATVITAGNATNGLSITPDNTGILELKTGTGSGTTALTLDASQNATIAGTLQVGGVATNIYPLVSGTAVASTSGTSIDFTGIPSTAKRITVMFNAVSTNGTSRVMLQLGSTTFTTTGYISSASQVTSGTPTSASNTTGFIIDDIANAAGVRQGHVLFTLISGNTWVESSVMGRSDSAGTNYSGGTVTLSGTLDRVRITTVNGTDTFDAGTINIMWE